MSRREQASAYCDQCEKQVLIQRSGGTNHILHLLLTIITSGLWLIVWIIVASAKHPWRCSQCGKNLGVGGGFGLTEPLFAKKPKNFEK